VWIGAEAGPYAYPGQALEVVQKKAIFGGVPTGAVRNLAQLEIPEHFEVISSDSMGL